MNNDAEFFIGWQGRAPPKTGRRLLRIAFGLGLVAVVGAAAFAALQGTIAPAVWDYGNEQEFTGVLWADPAPTLLAPATESAGDASTFLLVYPNKFGFDPDVARKFDQQQVRLRATVLHRDDQAMLEVTLGSIEQVEPISRPGGGPEWVDLGEHVLRGEIVDSKCFLGAMNPGELKPHRACAIRCISGGVPPILIVRDRAGRPIYYLLTGAAGEAINRDVLDFVAEPVEIAGRVLRRGKQLVLRARPGVIQRLP